MAQEPFETFTVGDMTVELHYDPDAESPRENDNLATLVLFGGGKYDLANEDPTFRTEDYDGWPEMVQDCSEKHGGVVTMVRAYDHSSFGLQAFDADGHRGYPWNCPWDSFWVGFAYIPLAKIVAEYGDASPESIKKARAVLRSEVDVYSLWIGGGFTGYVVRDANGEHIDSCWGFDDPEYCKQQAVEAAMEHAAKEVSV
jgi:hypothetical protein